MNGALTWRNLIFASQSDSSDWMAIPLVFALGFQMLRAGRMCGYGIRGTPHPKRMKFLFVGLGLIFAGLGVFILFLQVLLATVSYFVLVLGFSVGLYLGRKASLA